MNRAVSSVIESARQAAWWAAVVVWGLLFFAVLLGAPAYATPGTACTGAGLVTGPGAPSGSQVWVTDSADAFNQQTNAQNALAASLGCTVTDRWGRQSSQVNAVFGSCASSANDGTYTWTDAAHTCDMSLPLASGGGGSTGATIDAAAVALVFGSIAGMWAMGFGIGKSVAWVRKIADVA